MNDPQANQPNPNPENPDKKIHVDEDWKTQVEAEKQAVDKEPESGEEEIQGSQIPPASFSMLVTTLASQAAVGLGQPATPEQQQGQVDLGFAKHMVDTLEVLEEKTRGNLTTEEANMLTSILYQLRMAYVSVKNQVEQQSGKGSEGDEPKSSSIELP